MPSLAVMQVLLRELLTSERVDRIPEPELIMDDPEQVAAYTRAGREDGVMAAVYLFHCAQICEVIRDGDTVLDLGCGPATQLALVARLKPKAHFVGIDLSEEMLARAKSYVCDLGLGNIHFQRSSITDMAVVEDASVDAVFSTMALHHLPDAKHLVRTFEEVSRVLKPGGGIYLVDFGRLRSNQSINYFAHQYADRQPDLFTLDYLNSLRAAFSLADFKQANRCLEIRARLFSTFLVPYMVAVKSRPRDQGNQNIKVQIHRMRERLATYHQVDLNDLSTFFRFGGLRSQLLD